MTWRVVMDVILRGFHSRPEGGREKTWRISSIPVDVTKNELTEWLEGLGPPCAASDSNIIHVSLARSSKHSQQATVTFKTLPPLFSPAANQDRFPIAGPRGERVFCDCRFLDMTTLHTPDVESTTAME